MCSRTVPWGAKLSCVRQTKLFYLSWFRPSCLTQDKGHYDVAARHGVGPWKQGLLCAVLAAWDIFVDSHTLSPPADLQSPEVVLGRAYVARAKSLHKVLEALRDAWVEDTVNLPEEQIHPLC